jgi:hypothetical protein
MAVNLPPAISASLEEFERFTQSMPPPAYIEKWSRDTKHKKWLLRHTDGISRHLKNALMCVWYHQENLAKYQADVQQIYATTEVARSLKDRGFTVGTLPKWDAEYQAFVLAGRRALDYLARALAAYFQNDHNSFRKLPVLLASAQPKSVASALASVHSKHLPGLAYLLSDGSNKSIRDLISHYEHISAGCLNVNECGFTMAGGGEKLRLRENGYRSDGGLGNVILVRATELNNCVAELLDVFASEAAKVGSYGA